MSKEVRLTSPKSPFLRVILGLILLIVFLVLADLQYRDVGAPAVALIDIFFGLVMFLLIAAAVFRDRCLETILARGAMAPTRRSVRSAPAPSRERWPPRRMIGRLGRFTPDRTQSGHGDIASSVAKSGRERLVDSAFSFEYGIAVECRPLTLEEVRVKLM
jgi:hypothetical protein